FSCSAGEAYLTLRVRLTTNTQSPTASRFRWTGVFSVSEAEPRKQDVKVKFKHIRSSANLRIMNSRTIENFSQKLLIPISHYHHKNQQSGFSVEGIKGNPFYDMMNRIANNKITTGKNSDNL